MNELVRSSLEDPDGMRDRLVVDGYVFVPQLLPGDEVAAVGREMADILAGQGVVDAETLRPTANPLVPGTRPFYRVYQGVQSSTSFHLLAYHPALLAAVEVLLGEAPFVHPRKELRMTFPSAMRRAAITPSHQDYPAIQGTVDCISVWLPLTPCPPERGGLRMLVGSHAGGLRPIDRTTGSLDISVTVGDDEDPLWATTSYLPGDVLLFHSLTVHGSLPNTTDQIRLAADFRLQSPSDAVVEDALAPHAFRGIESWAYLTGGWPDDVRRMIAESPAPPIAPFVSPYGNADGWFVELPPSRLLGASR